MCGQNISFLGGFIFVMIRLETGTSNTSYEILERRWGASNEIKKNFSPRSEKKKVWVFPHLLFEWNTTLILRIILTVYISV